MRLRHWLLASLAVPVLLAATWSFPEIAEASIGVGVQAGPVRLGSIAHPGGNYQLPPVYVVDTGTEAEFISLRIERLAHGPGRAVPRSRLARLTSVPPPRPRWSSAWHRGQRPDRGFRPGCGGPWAGCSCWLSPASACAGPASGSALSAGRGPQGRSLRRCRPRRPPPCLPWCAADRGRSSRW